LLHFGLENGAWRSPADAMQADQGSEKEDDDVRPIGKIRVGR